MKAQKLNSKFGFKKIEDVKIPKNMFSAKSTGNEDLDRILSYKGGVVQAQTIFLTGMPGAGKTTVACVIANGIKEPERPVVLIQIEMIEEQIKFQFGKIKGLNDFIILDKKSYPPTSNLSKAPDRFAENISIFKEILDEIYQMNACCVIVDSIQELASIMDGYNDYKSQKDIVKVLYDWNKESNIPLILIGHCNKDGKYEGPPKLQRTLDTHITCSYDRKTDERKIYCEGKNRMGGSLDQLDYEITNSGVQIKSNMYKSDFDDE